MEKDQYIAQNKLEGQIALILMKAGVTGPEIDHCLEWAFGPGALYFAPAEWPDKWNKLHPQHPAKKNEKFVEFIFTMGS